MKQSIITIIIFFSSHLLHSQEKQWTLEDCIDYALENNLSLEASKLDLALSETSQKYVKYRYLPILNTAGTHGYNLGQSIDPFTNEFATDRVRSNNLYLSSSWTLFSGFERYYISKKANHELQYQQFNYEVKKRNLRIDVTAQFLQVLLNHYQSEVVQEQLKYTQKERERCLKLVELQEKTKYDLYQIEAQVASDSLIVTKASNELHLSKLQLKQFLNMKSEDKFEIYISQDVENSLQARLTDINYEQLPEFKQYEMLEKTSLSNLKLNKSKRYPSLVLNSSLGSGYSGNNKEFQGEKLVQKPFNKQLEENFYQSANLTLYIPIFNNAQAAQNIALARVELQKSQVEKEKALLDIQNKIEQLKIEIGNVSSELQASKTSLKSAELSFQSAELKYNEGLISFIEYVEVRTQLFKAKSELLKAKFLYKFKLDILECYLV